MAICVPNWLWLVTLMLLAGTGGIEAVRSIARYRAERPRRR